MTIKALNPIVLVEDDPDDQHLFLEAIKQLEIRNPVKIFNDGQEALDYLNETTDHMFLILCDINMPKLNGLQFRDEIIKSDYLRNKSIPFVFLSTGIQRSQVVEAYNLTVQGFFQKTTKFPELVSLMKKLYDYWSCCEHPNR